MSDEFTVKPFDLARTLERELAAARAESEEQARLLGMSAERECDLRGRLERLERELAAARAEVAALAKAAEAVLESYIIEKKVEAGHPCPENLVICRELRAAIAAARIKEPK